MRPSHTRPGSADPDGRPTPDQLREAVSRGTRVALWTVLASTALALVKISAGVVGNSYALVADGVESITDVFSSLLVVGGLRLSARPSSDDFPYGLGKAEALAAVMVAVILLSAGLGIAIQAIHEIRVPHAVPAAWTLAVLAGVVVVKETLFRSISVRARRSGSRLMHTDAWHHRSDALTSLAAFIGISVALVGGAEWASADDWAALVACGVIFWNGSRLLWRSVKDVLDVSAPPGVRARIRGLASAVPDVVEVEQLRVRRSGLTYLVDIHVEVAPEMTVREGHEVAHRVKDALVGCELPVLDVLVHVEPHGPAPPDPHPVVTGESPGSAPGREGSSGFGPRPQPPSTSM